jgi:hypothetical protein
MMLGERIIFKKTIMSDQNKSAWYSLEKPSMKIIEMTDEDFRRIWSSGEDPSNWTADRNKLVIEKNRWLQKQVEEAKEALDIASFRAKQFTEAVVMPKNIVVPMALWARVVEHLAWARLMAQEHGLSVGDEIDTLLGEITEATKG